MGKKLDGSYQLMKHHHESKSVFNRSITTKPKHPKFIAFTRKN